MCLNAGRVKGAARVCARGDDDCSIQPQPGLSLWHPRLGAVGGGSGYVTHIFEPRRLAVDFVGQLATLDGIRESDGLVDNVRYQCSFIMAKFNVKFGHDETALVGVRAARHT